MLFPVGTVDVVPPAPLWAIATVAGSQSSRITRAKSVVRRVAPNDRMFDIATFTEKRINVQIRSKA